jgi:hypothetical protein
MEPGVRENYEGLLQKLSKRELVEATLGMLSHLSAEQLGVFDGHLHRMLEKEGVKELEGNERKKRESDHSFDMSKYAQHNY